MRQFLVELYVSRSESAATRRDTAARARSAAQSLDREGSRVRYVRSLFVPDEETCFYLYEAADPGVVREAARRADLPVQSVVEAFSADAERPGAE
jgi:hypothetical protein